MFISFPQLSTAQLVPDSIRYDPNQLVKCTGTKNLEEDSLILEKLPPRKSYFQAGLTYITNNADLGRTDTAAISYYTTSIAYYHKSGLYAKASIGYVLNSVERQADLFSLEAGYDLIAGNYDGEIVGTKYYYSSSSTNVNAEIKESVALTNAYDFGVIKPSLSATLSVDAEIDYALGLGMEHSFTAFDEALEITPKFLANGSTLNFYSDYYKKRRYSIKRKGKIISTGKETVTGQVIDPNAFKILDYEASCEIKYTLGKFEFDFVPTYAIPVNPSMINITRVLQNGTVKQSTQTEKIGNIFYCSLGVTWSLK